MMAEVCHALPALARFDGVEVVPPTKLAIDFRKPSAGAVRKGGRPDVEGLDNVSDANLEQLLSMK
jgi:hypothetical protein